MLARRKRLFSVGILVVLLIITMYGYFLNVGHPPDDGKKMILTWTPFFGRPMTHEHYLSGCPFTNACFITYDQWKYQKADAFVFHPPDLKLNNLPPIRRVEQVYVFLSHESPIYTNPKDYGIPNFFNWTMTYRMDSDVPYPYSYLRKDEDIPTSNIDLHTIVLTKSKNKNKVTSLVAWFVSNCFSHSKREQYVAELRKYIPVDIYGGCGNLSCPRSVQSKCDRLLNEAYKFYIAFENSLCLDYATEKLHGRIHLNAVPIVLKRSLVEHLLPKGSFIAANDFQHPKFLAAYLTYLDSNDTAYLEYFQWRNQGYIPDIKDANGNYFGFCGLCQRLLQGNYEQKSYSDLKAWWLTGSQCDSDIVPRLIGSKPMTGLQGPA